MNVSVIGLGSGHGDDRIGLAALQALARHGLPPHVSLHPCTNPAVELLPLLAATQHAILLDAMVDDGPSGRVRACEPEALGAKPGQASSHGVSVREVLALAGALGMLPPRLQLLGVTISPQPAPLTEQLSPAVRDALPHLVRQVLQAAALEPTT